MFESQLPIKLDLSFVKTKAMSQDENPRRPRSPELRRELMNILDTYGEAVGDDTPHAPP